MIKPTYYRQHRTPSSEQYQLMEGEERLAHLDLHYGTNDVFGTLVLDRELSEEDVAQLVEQIDADLVESADVAREDFMIRVYVGKEVGLGLYSAELLEDEYAAEEIDGYNEQP